MNKIEEYQNYITNHIDNVHKAFSICGGMLCEELNIDYNELEEQISIHDESKWEVEEFDLYRQKFHPEPGEKEVSRYDFNKAWLHHIHNNPHHSEHWILYDPEEKQSYVYDMPDNYIAEMLLDWIAMSYAKGGTAYDYYYSHKNKYTFTYETRFKVEYLLGCIKAL